MSDDTDGIGYGKPPKTTRFEKGVSGNPKGRPPGSHRQAPYEAVLGQKVIVRDNGTEMVITAAEAFLLKLSNEGLQGDGHAARLTLDAIEGVAGNREKLDSYHIDSITFVVVAPGSVGTALEPLRMAKKMDRYRDSARFLLEPWIVEKALARLGARRLGLEDQKTVLEATRTPKKVRWPEWWVALPE